MEEQPQPSPQQPKDVPASAIISPEVAESTDTTSQESQSPSGEGSHSPSPGETRRELEQAVEGSEDVLASANTVLTIFPDTLTIDRAKVTVTKRTFFAAGEIVSMRIEDILNVTITMGPFFGIVKIVSRVLNEKPYSIGKFWRHDAINLKRILQGYVIALQRHIDCSSLPTRELVHELYHLGEDNHDV